MSSGHTGPLGGGAESLESPDQDALHSLCLADPVWRERYEGWTELGRGATAIVVRTRSRALGEDVALKIFPAPFSQDGKRFQEEVRNAQRLASPYIVRIYSPFPRGSLAWIEMELVDGVNLRQELEQRHGSGRAFSLAETLAIGQAVAEALSAAHQAGVLHRDVKPANLLLPRSGSPVAKLGDFGVSRQAGAAALTRTGLLVGTPQFVAPEVIEGAHSGPASDVYSFGHCLYLMLSGGRFPFALEEGASPLNWMRAHAEQAPIPVRVHNPDVPPGLAALVASMLAKDPARRPSAREVAASLSALRAGDLPPELGAGVRGPRGRVAMLIGGITLVLAALLTWRGLEARRPTQARSPAAPPSVETPAPAPAATVPAPEPSSKASPHPGSPASPPVQPPALPVSASLRGELVGLRNTGADPLPALEITLLFAAPPGRSTARHPEGLAPGEELLLSLDSFEPVAPAGARPTSIEVVAADPAGPRRRRLTLR
jgi:serine/threonine protein kinase